MDGMRRNPTTSNLQPPYGGTMGLGASLNPNNQGMLATAKDGMSETTKPL